jgi:hypothetical protein
MKGVAPKIHQTLLAGTSRRTKAKRKSPPELLCARPVIQETNVDPPAILLAILDREEDLVLLLPIVPADSQEATAQQCRIWARL